MLGTINPEDSEDDNEEDIWQNIDDDDDDDNAVGPTTNSNTNSHTREGHLSVTTQGKKIITVSQWTNYRYRCEDCRNLSLYEYIGIMQRIPMTDSELITQGKGYLSEEAMRAIQEEPIRINASQVTLIFYLSI